MSMRQVIENIEREAFERATKPMEEMSLVEFAERVSPIPLSVFEKKLFKQYEECLKQGKSLYVIPPRCGRRMFENELIKEWQKQNALTEHRCTCGRLLGRFSGQAEIKCPKCGKMNVIGVENHG